MEELKLNDISENLLIFNKATIDKLFQSENPADVVSLYIFYYYTAKWQHTNQPKCTTHYTANALKWGEAKTRKVKKQLSELGLIEDVKSRDENGEISGHFIKVNYILKQSTLSNIHTLKNPQGGEIHSVAGSETNALKEYIKCLKKEIEMLKDNKEINKENPIEKILKDYTQSETTLDLLHEWLKVRKAQRAANTERSIELNIKKLDKLAKQSNLSVNDYLKEAIARSWRSFFPITDFKFSNNRQPNDKTYSGYRNL